MLTVVKQNEPGDEKENEGKVTNSDSNFGDYQCVFRQADDSLYILLKNKKSKRAFTSTFTKSTLIEMDLKQSIDKVINLLEAARSGVRKKELTFTIGFGGANNNKKVPFDKLSTSYSKGCALFICVTIDNPYMESEYVFKLLEQSCVMLCVSHTHFVLDQTKHRTQ